MYLDKYKRYYQPSKALASIPLLVPYLHLWYLWTSTFLKQNSKQSKKMIQVTNLFQIFNIVQTFYAQNFSDKIVIKSEPQ